MVSWLTKLIRWGFGTARVVKVRPGASSGTGVPNRRSCPRLSKGKAALLKRTGEISTAKAGTPGASSPACRTCKLLSIVSTLNDVWPSRSAT